MGVIKGSTAMKRTTLLYIVLGVLISVVLDVTLHLFVYTDLFISYVTVIFLTVTMLFVIFMLNRKG